ncbi:regulator of ribonuclease activity A [Vitreoscilla sp. C1]|uniref:ribonuclease E activity regulator RraA n=1 Tax=Vitreoscilla sp. (strain C1) TaxID=96942 RepID=UPI000CF3A89B|nr:ribonuclease E activity regulator RraA [Vitreoscilla sp. C1]AUZ04320.2 regulator of ribonuclease activity A [Vitreoscilla sp. C1]
MPLEQAIQTADLIDLAPETPSCEVQFKRYGKHQRFSGRTRTVRCFRDNGLVKILANSSGNGDILVVDGGGSLASALMGDQIAQAACDNQWGGVIIYGVIRDSVAINRMEMGLKALGTNPRKSAKDGVGEVDVTVSFGAVDFVPGHYVYSDEDGILVSPEPIHHS